MKIRGNAYCRLNMVGDGLALLQQFLTPALQLRGDELDAGGLLDGFGFNLAGVVIAQLRFWHFDYRMVRMSGESFAESFENLDGDAQFGGAGCSHS